MPQREALRWVLGLFDDDEDVVARTMGSVPPTFELETATDLHELVYALARPMQAFRRVIEKRRLTDFARACHFVRDFPRSHWDLDQLDLQVRSDFRRRLEGVYQNSENPTVQAEVKRILEYGRPRRPYVCRKFKQSLFDVTRTAASLHVQRGDVRRLVAAGHLRARPVAGGKSRGHYVIRREDVEALATRLNARMGWREFCSQASLPTLAVEQMLAAGMLRAREDPAVTELFGDRQICLPHAEQLLERFGDLPEEDAEGWPALKQVMWGVGGREKPWARVLEAGLTGELPGGLRRDPYQPDLGHLKVHPITATSLIMGGPDCDSPFAFSAGDYGRFLRLSLRPGEVEAHLNCTAQDVIWLRSRGYLTPANQKGRPTIYSRVEVEDLGRRFATTREIAARLGVKPKDAWISLEGVSNGAQIGQGFYDRSVIEGVMPRPPRYPASSRT